MIRHDPYSDGDTTIIRKSIAMLRGVKRGQLRAAQKLERVSICWTQIVYWSVLVLLSLLTTRWLWGRWPNE